MSNVDVIGQIEADVSSGGWQASGEVFNDADRLQFHQQLECWFDLFTDAWEPQPRPGFAGHLIPDTWQRLFQHSLAPFSAFTGHEFMRQGEVQGIFFKHVASSPANQHQIVDMTYAKIVEHILGKSGEVGHSNMVKGIWPEGIVRLNIDHTNSSAVSEYEVKNGSYWDRLQEIANIDLYYLFVDKFNTVHFIQHPMFGASLPDPVFTLTSDWLLSPLTITRRHEKIGQVKLQGTTPAGLQITGKYPTAAQPGPIVQRSGYMASSNANMNTIAQRMYRFENRSHTIMVELAGAVGLMIDLMDRIAVTYTSAVDGITWSSKKFWVHKIQVEILRNFNTRTVLTLEAEN